MTTTCDTGFAHAVRLASNGLRPKPRVDTVLEGGPLRTILCSGLALDKHGLELLARAVTGTLRKINQPSDETEFACAVRRAGAAWRTGKAGGKPSETGALLADMLRSGQPVLGYGEREELAELFSPQQPDAENALIGRPPKGAGQSKVIEVMKFLRNELRKEGSIRKNAIVDTADRFGISVRTVEKYEAMTEERDNIIEKMKTIYGQSPAKN